jgi:uncharacterized protein with PQ loop repeat
MNSDYLMYSASFLYLSCYIPELYANYKNKNANIYNIPEKIMMLTATSLGLSYAIINENNALMVNYGPMLSLDIAALLMRLYYAYLYKEINEHDISIENLEEPHFFCENI